MALAIALSGESYCAAEPAALPADHAERTTRGLALFKSDVRKLLVDRCLACHGGKKTEGELDLSSREGLLHGGATGPAAVPFDASASLLVRLVSHADEPQMPFEQEKLPEAAIGQLSAWIDLGAPYDEPLVAKTKKTRKGGEISDADRRFWSFLPLVQAAPPDVRDESWCRTPIDRFVLARLEARNLAPNGPAERRRLIRRASLDLLGLPPTPEEVEQFVTDPAPNAWESLLERLLSSPHYGERWGRHWLDLARFAESHGYEQDYDRPNAYHYRDFVIRALNRDLPYNTFAQWQIAGDELAPDDPEALLATGFLAAGVHATQITANQAEKERYDELDDMVRTIGTTMLGLTLGCARCHDHKYDPVSTRDYYRLAATFSTTVRSDYDVITNAAEHRAALAQFERAHAPFVAALARYEADELPGRLDAWLAQRAAGPKEPAWIVLVPTSSKSSGGATFVPQDDGSLLATGTNADFDTYEFVCSTPLAGITAIRVEALADPSLVKGGPGRADNGNFDLTDVRVAAAPTAGESPPVGVQLTAAKATFEQGGPLCAAAAIDGDKKSGWAVDPQFGRDHAVVFETAADVGAGGGTQLTITLQFNGNNKHNIGRVRLSAAARPRPVGLEGPTMPPGVQAILARLDADPARQLPADERGALLAWYRTTDERWRQLRDAEQSHRQEAPRPQTVKALISSEGVPAVRLHTQGLDFYDPVHFLKRGDPNQKIAPATAGFLEVLSRASDGEARWQSSPPPGARTSQRRTALARWLTDVEAGAGNLLARVIVNRVWHYHFGRGLVSTPSDFGAQGQPPSHPELLETLADELVRGGWQLKPLHKRIMASSVYVQDSATDPVRTAADPDNALLWHYPRHRLEAEVIRDAMLAASGQLDRTPFGPGTLDANHKRRSIYFFVKRSKLVPMMVLFDGPDTLQDLAQRATTTVAPQALALLNGEQIRSYADALAARLRPADETVPADAVRAAYRLVVCRQPTAAELDDCTAFLAAAADGYRSAGKANPLELALGDLCQALLGLNEFVFVD